MKQTKKLTRRQREFLIRNNVNVEGVRVRTDTPTKIVYITPDGVEHVLYK